MGDSPSHSPHPPPDVAASGDFVTRYPKEVKTFVWRIEDLATILDMNPWPSSWPSIQFDAGASIGMPSKWKVDMYPHPDNVSNLRMRLLCVKHVEGGVAPKNVTCEATLETVAEPKRDLAVISLHPQLPQHFMKRASLNLAMDGKSLPIHLKFVMYGNPVTTRGENKSCYMIQKMTEDVTNNLGTLLETGYNSDFVIKVKKLETEEEWVEIKVHKAILGTRSQFFGRMFETEMTESKTAILEIVDLSPECVKLILKWIYTGILDEGWKKTPEEMIKAGDKYGLTLLVQFLDENLHLACTFENAINLRGMAKFHGLVTATKNVTKFIAKNLDIVLN